MYNLINGIDYSKYSQKLLRRLSEVNIEESILMGKMLYNELLLTSCDYALFLSFYDRYRQMGNVNQVVHLGENCLFRVYCFWDHLAFFLNQYFHKYAYYLDKKNKVVFINDNNVSFRRVLCCLKKNAKELEVYEQIIYLNNLYKKCKPSSKIRNISTHRYHSGFISIYQEKELKYTSMAIGDRLLVQADSIKEALDSDFNVLISAMKTFITLEKSCFNSIPCNNKNL